MTSLVHLANPIQAAGHIGRSFTEALLKTGKHTITALTRQGSKSKLPDGVNVARVNYDDEASVVEALSGQDFLVITLSGVAPGEVHSKITTAAGKAGVRYIMPNLYAYDANSDEWRSLEEKLGRIQKVMTMMDTERTRDVQDSRAISIKLSCGFWYEWSLACGDISFGFNIKDRKVTFFDDGRYVIDVSTWNQCGRALAALLNLPESGASPSLSDFKNKNVPVLSFRISQRDMLDSLHRVLGTTDADWEISSKSPEEQIRENEEKLDKGDHIGIVKMLYASIFVKSNKASDYAALYPTANNILGLPEEDLDEATKRAVDMVESGWTPVD